jgi:hypothetical protein
LKPLAHAVTSGVISACVGLYFKSAACAAISLASGTLIDIDHLLDYFAGHPFTVRFKDIYEACEETRMKKLYLVLHSYEIVIMLWVLIYAFSLSNAWKALAIGLTQHLIFDQMTNDVNSMIYFFSYRLMNDFRSEKLVHKKERLNGCS